MSYWANNPELYNEIIFRQMVVEGLANEDDDPGDAVCAFDEDPRFSGIALRAEQNYWAGKTNEAMMRRENGR